MRVVLSNCYGTQNVGDQGILVSMIDALQGGRPSIEVDVLTLTPADTHRRHPAVQAIRSGVLRGLLSTCRSLRRADVLVVGGGGILQDATSRGNLLLHLSRPILARMLGTPVVLSGVGIGPMRSRLGRWLTGVVCRRAEAISVRDQASADFLAEIGVPTTSVTVAPDLALALQAEGPGEGADAVPGFLQELRTSAPLLIGLSLRPPVGTRRQRRRRPPWFCESLRAVASTADDLAERHDARFVFVSMHPEQDDPLADELRSRMRCGERLAVLSGEATPKAVLRSIGLLDMLIGMRLHSLIFAAKTGVPFVAMSYDRKIAEFLHLLGMGDQMVATRNWTVEGLTGVAEATLRRRGNIHETLQRVTPDLEARARENVEAIRRIITERLP